MFYPSKKFVRLVDISRALFDKPQGRFKHFTFVLKGTKVLSIGFNDVYADRARLQDKTSIRYPYGGVHSEASAVANLTDLNILKKCTLVNVRLNYQQEIQNSKPCSVCQGWLQRFKFRSIYYSTPEGFFRLY